MEKVPQIVIDIVKQNSLPYIQEGFYKMREESLEKEIGQLRSQLMILKEELKKYKKIRLDHENQANQLKEWLKQFEL